jgi:hypothetical protein
VPGVDIGKWRMRNLEGGANANSSRQDADLGDGFLGDWESVLVVIVVRILYRGLRYVFRPGS